MFSWNHFSEGFIEQISEPMWFCAAPWGPVRVPTSHPTEDSCVTERWVQCLVWARNHFGEGLIEQISLPVWFCAATLRSIDGTNMPAVFYHSREDFWIIERCS